MTKKILVISLLFLVLAIGIVAADCGTFKTGAKSYQGCAAYGCAKGTERVCTCQASGSWSCSCVSSSSCGGGSSGSGSSTGSGLSQACKDQYGSDACETAGSTTCQGTQGFVCVNIVSGCNVWKGAASCGSTTTSNTYCADPVDADGKPVDPANCGTGAGKVKCYCKENTEGNVDLCNSNGCTVPYFNSNNCYVEYHHCFSLSERDPIFGCRVSDPDKSKSASFQESCGIEQIDAICDINGKLETDHVSRVYGDSCGGSKSECGDGNKDSGEQCELPNTQNNAYCPQTSGECKDGKVSLRDTYGNCDASCGCDTDDFKYVCVPGQCGATCIDDADCDDQNPNTIDSCKDECTCRHEEEPYCGDGVFDEDVDGACEFNANEGESGYAENCRDDDFGEEACTFCGDNVLQADLEACDLGSQNGVEGSGCTATCRPENEVPEFSPVGAVFATIALGGFLFVKRR